MPIDAELVAYYARVARELPLPATLDVAARRHRMETIAERFPARPDDVQRSDRCVAAAGREIPIRIYRPRSASRAGIIYFHGGGWIAGSIRTHDGACAVLARDAQAIVISIDYRRPPEHPYPAPNEDARIAIEWAFAHAGELDVDVERIAVGGDSAGAHLAACATIDAQAGRGLPLCAQLLIYPVIAPDFDTRSYREHAVTPSLTRDDMIWYWSQYFPNHASDDFYCSIPSRAASHVGLPPAHVVVAGFDPLRDEGAHYAGLLEAAGVPVTLREERALTHGFLRAAPYVKAAREAQRALGVAIGNLLRTSSHSTSLLVGPV